jgi:hypothetical protein
MMEIQFSFSNNFAYTQFVSHRKKKAYYYIVSMANNMKKNLKLALCIIYDLVSLLIFLELVRSLML